MVAPVIDGIPVATLLRWFDRQARDLPWRRTRDPYAIWISEVMLQQTQVKTVVPYWERWLRELPDVATLASAPIDRVLKLWEGLGYYSRARNLQRAAREILARHAGRFPNSVEALLGLPGIGRYTAGAIASIAFNQPAPILDGNVVRVLTRLRGIRADPRGATTRETLWRLAERGVQEAARRGGMNACSRFNQGLMELGALVCTPRTPKCPDCPWKRTCVARRKGWVDQLPHRPQRPAAINRRFVVLVVRQNDRWLVRQRPAGGVNAGLWEFPTVEVSTEANTPLQLAMGELGVRPRTFEPSGSVKTSITRYRLTLDLFDLVLGPRQGCAAKGAWKTAPELLHLAFSSAQRRILRRAIPMAAPTAG